MKKLGSFLLTLFVVTLSLYAQKTTLNVLYYADATAAGYAEEQSQFDKFRAANPNIDLQMEILFNDPYAEKLNAYVAAGEMPDVMLLWPTTHKSSAIIHEKKLAADLGKVLPQSLLSKYSANALNPNNQASKQLSLLPQSFTHTSVLYVNAGLLKKNGIAIPKTYADIKAMVPKLKAKGIGTLALPNADKWPAQSCFFSTISGRLLGDAFIDSVLAGKAKFTDKAFVDALKFYEQLFKDGIIDKGQMTLGYGDGPGLLASGKVAMFIDGDWRVGAYLTDRTTGKALIDPKLQSSDFELINFPAIPGEKNAGSTSAIAGIGLGMNKDLSGDKLKAALKFFDFYYSKDFQTFKWETGAYVPTRTDVTTNKLEPLAVKLPQFYKTVTKTTYVIDGVLNAKVNNALNDGLQAIGLGSKTAQQVAEEMQAAQDEVSSSMMMGN